METVAIAGVNASVNASRLDAMAAPSLNPAQFPNPAQALRSLDVVESCLTAMTDLPRREMEVCARVLLCQTALGISLSLEISEESVKTYRARAYRRLGIGGVRELWMWYLNLWYLWQLELLAVGSNDRAFLACQPTQFSTRN